VFKARRVRIVNISEVCIKMPGVFKPVDPDCRNSRPENPFDASQSFTTIQ
jgi:hypothetical protein